MLWRFPTALLGVAAVVDRPQAMASTMEVEQPSPTSFLGFEPQVQDGDACSQSQALEDMFNALQVLQKDYYNTDYGTWPTAIDWTAAFAQTLLSGTLTTLTESLRIFEPSTRFEQKENLLMTYFHQVVGSYFGQDTLSVRGEVFFPLSCSKNETDKH